MSATHDEVRLGILLWSQATEWAPFEAAARRVEELGYDSLWTWDHLYAIFGDPYQPIFEGYTTLAAWARVTSSVKLGPNSWRNDPKLRWICLAATSSMACIRISSSPTTSTSRIPR